MKVLANDGMSQMGIDFLQKNNIEFVDHKVAQNQLADFINENQISVLLVRSATEVRKDLIDACPSLKIIGRGGIGMDNIDVEYARGKGIHVINTPTASSRSVAELVFGHFFSLSRYLHDANRMMPLEGETKFSALKKSYAKATELSGKTLGIIGFGSIGKEVAKIGIGMGMKIRVLTTKARKEQISLEFFDGQSCSFEIQTEEQISAFLPHVDFLSLNVPKTQGYLIDAEEFRKMKSNAIIVNTARGGVLNERALLDALEDGEIAGAALDVFENEPTPSMAVLMNPKISLSPHVGGNTQDAQDKIGLELAQQILQISQSQNA